MLLTHSLPFHIAKHVLLRQHRHTVDVFISSQHWTPWLSCWQRYSADASGSVDSLPTDARVVIAGGGIVGCSVAYHLAKAGWKDIVLLEQGRSVAYADVVLCKLWHKFLSVHISLLLIYDITGTYVFRVWYQSFYSTYYLVVVSHALQLVLFVTFIEW